MYIVYTYTECPILNPSEYFWNKIRYEFLAAIYLVLRGISSYQNEFFIGRSALDF